MPIAEGDTVKVVYRGTFDDGEIFDETEDGEPLEFTAGAGEVIDGFDRAVIGLEEGDETEVTLAPIDAYGDHDPDLVQEIPKDKFPAGPLAEGDMFFIESPDGEKVLTSIVGINETGIVIDLNHPLAGKDLSFTIKIVEVVKAE